MTQPPTPAELEQFKGEIPRGLRALLERELAAGNRVAWIAGGFPAPPRGNNLMFEQRLLSGTELPAGVTCRVRNSTLVSEEYTEEPGYYFLLTPPGPPPPEPDMDAIRAAHNPPLVLRMPVVPGMPLRDDWLELDIRGETIIYHAGPRRATIEWTYTRGHRLYRDSLQEWFDPDARVVIPMGEEEVGRVLARILELAPAVLGTTKIEVE
jgi:hypothetical protein